MKERDLCGKFKRSNITDEELKSKKFGNLTFISFVEPGHKGITRCKWKCDCGNEKVISLWNVIYQTDHSVKSCGCLRKRYNNQHPNWNGCGEISGNIWNRIKQNAQGRNIPFTITPEEIWNIFIKQNRKCALTGVDLHFNKNRCREENTNASLDRIDSTKGYSADNVQWVHKDVNNIKWDFSEKELLEWVEKIYDYKIKKVI